METKAATESLNADFGKELAKVRGELEELAMAVRWLAEGPKAAEAVSHSGSTGSGAGRSVTRPFRSASVLGSVEVADEWCDPASLWVKGFRNDLMRAKSLDHHPGLMEILPKAGRAGA